MRFYEKKYLVHHGILGQKWGVRRYQNPDGTLTSEGKLRYNKNVKVVKFDPKKANNIYKTFTSKEKWFFSGDAYDETPEDYEYADKHGFNLKAFRHEDSDYGDAPFSFMLQYKDTPVAFLLADAEGWNNDEVNIAIGVRNDNKFRHKGYAQYMVDKAIEWFESEPGMMSMNWRAFADNSASVNLAKSRGFEFYKEDESGPGTVAYRRTKKKVD